jgi:ribosomal protein S18 acetylase RimI-like enzyme
VIRTLNPDDLESLFGAFTAAFSDYVVPFSPTREQFVELITRRGWIPALSVGEFDGDQMVAFTINAAEGERAYDSGTGVAPGHRRRGLARELMARSFEVLRAHGCRAYVLEVIDSNVKAVDLYRSMGFEDARGLQCWSYPIPSSAAPALLPAVPHDAPSWWEIQPSWQNSLASIARAGAPHVVVGDENGYAVVFPDNGDLAQLAVRPGMRRKGMGKRLLEQAAAAAGKRLRILNVDERHDGIARFLDCAGATRSVRQIEMTRSLQ